MWRALLTHNAALALQYAANALLPLVLVPHFVRTLGVTDYGALAILIAAMSLAAVVVQYAFHLTGPAELAALPSESGSRQLFVDVLAARLLLLGALAVVMAAVVGSAATFAVAEKGVLLDAVLLFGLPSGAALNAGWYLQARGRFAAMAVLSICSVLAALAVGVLMVQPQTAGARHWAALASITAPLIVGLGSLILAARLLPRHPAVWHPGRALAALQRGRALFASQIFAAIYSLAGPLVVGALAGVREAGLYSAIERPAAALQAALGLTHTAAYPRLAAHHAAGNHADYRRLLSQVLWLQAGGLSLLAALLATFNAPIARFLLGAEVVAAPLLWLAFCWIGIGMVGPIVTGYLTVRGEGAQVFRLTTQVLLVSLPLGVAAALAMGAAGWFVALAAGQVLVIHRAWRLWRAV